jgi:hypothetical protein
MVAPNLNGASALATPLPSAPSEASNEPAWGSAAPTNSGKPQPNATSTDTPAGANAGSTPGVDLAKAMDATLQKGDEILKKWYGALGLEYKPPATHLDRVRQAITVSQKLSGKDLDGFLRSMESAGKDFGINFGLSRGTGKLAKALNFGDAAFKGVDGAKRRQLHDNLRDQMPPKAAASSTAGDTGDAGSATGKPKVSDQLFGLVPEAAAKESFTQDDVKALAGAAIKKVPSQAQAGVAKLFEKVLSQFDAKATEGKLSNQDLRQLIDTVATNPTPQTDAGKPSDEGSGATASGDKQLATLRQSVLQQWPSLGVADKEAYNGDEVKTIASRLDAEHLPDGLKGAAPAIKTGLADLVSQAKGRDVKKDDLADLIAKALMAELTRKKTE